MASFLPIKKAFMAYKLRNLMVFLLLDNQMLSLILK
jgi:hypothetical protein